MATVSAAIPVYNGADFIAEAVESVFTQTRLPDEVLVVDDGSTDATPEILRELADRYPLRVIHQENGGEASARNRLVQEAKGDLIAFLDNDDTWEPEKLRRQLAHFEPTWGMSFTAFECFGGKSEVVFAYDDTWNPDAALASLEHFTMLAPSTTLTRRAALLAVEPFEQITPFGADWLMWLRLAKAGNRIGYLREPLTAYRVHDNNMSRNDQGSYFDSACAVMDRYGDPRLRAWWRLNTAVYAHEHGDRKRARQRLLEAALIHPRSVRPGWVRLAV